MRHNYTKELISISTQIEELQVRLINLYNRMELIDKKTSMLNDNSYVVFGLILTGALILIDIFINIFK